MKSVSFAVIGNSLVALYQIDKPAALKALESIEEGVKDQIPEAITTIYITEKDKTKLPFIAKHLLKGMFLSQDPRTQQMYGDAFKWIAESDNKEAISNLTDDFVKLGKQYQKFNFDKMAVNMLNQMVQLQIISTNTNKSELILILKTGMSKLIE